MRDKPISSDPKSFALEVVLETALDAAIVIDDKGNVVAWNAVAERTFGWKFSEVSGAQLSKLIIPEEFRSHHDDGLKRYLTTGVAKALGKHIEIVAINRVGHRFPAELSTTEFVRSNKRLFIGFLRDISLRKEAEEQVREVRERLDLAVRTHAIGVFDADAASGVVRWNAEAERIYGYAPGEIEMTMQCWRKHVLQNDLLWLDEIYKQAQAIKSDEISYSYRIRRRDGALRDIEASAKLFYDENGHHARRVGVNIDVTERRVAENRLAETQAELIHVSRLNSLGAIASSLSHELNQPLQAIGTYIHAAKRILEKTASQSDQLAVSALDAAIETTMKVGHLIKQLRSMASKGVVESSQADILTVVTDTASLVRDEAQAANIIINIQFDREATSAFADPILLQQVVFNLLRNSIQALAPAGGIIDVHGSIADAKHVLIEVTDNGPGLPKNISSAPFTAFASTKADGMGVGLSICRTIIEKLGGRIKVISSDAETLVNFTLLRARPIEDDTA